jgi:hypothetical protein
MSELKHYSAVMTAAEVKRVLDGEPVEVYPEGAESRTVVPQGGGHGGVNGHYRFCIMGPEHLAALLVGEEVVIVSYDDRYHLSLKP